MSRKFSMRCTMGVLLVDRVLVTAVVWVATTEESVHYSACVKQVINGTEMAGGFRLRRRLLPGNREVGPLLGYE